MIKRLPMKSLLTLFGSKGGGGGEFDPLTFDAGNLLALWDGDNAGASNWLDEVASHNLVYGSTGGGAVVNLVPAGLNGHQYVLFEQNGGTFRGSYASAVTPVRAQPTTQYIVMGNNYADSNNYSFDDGVNTLRNAVQNLSSPNLKYVSVSSTVNPISNIPSLGTFFILTIVKQSGVNQSLVQVNKNTPDNYTQGALSNDAGICLNGNSSHGVYTFVEPKFAYIIIRNGVDSPEDRIQFQDYLISRFAL